MSHIITHNKNSARAKTLRDKHLINRDKHLKQSRKKMEDDLYVESRNLSFLKKEEERELKIIKSLLNFIEDKEKDKMAKPLLNILYKIDSNLKVIFKKDFNIIKNYVKKLIEDEQKEIRYQLSLVCRHRLPVNCYFYM